MKNLILILLLTFVFIGCKKESAQIKTVAAVSNISSLNNPFAINKGDTVFVHVDMYPAQFRQGTFFNGNVYMSQEALFDTYITVKYHIYDDTLTRQARLVMPYLFSQWTNSTWEQAYSLNYTTTKVEMISIETSDKKHIFIYK